jgi:hypothetical protein
MLFLPEGRAGVTWEPSNKNNALSLSLSAELRLQRVNPNIDQYSFCLPSEQHIKYFENKLT